MAVAVSLAELVKTPDTLHLWPEQFVALMAKVEADVVQTALDVTMCCKVKLDSDDGLCCRCRASVDQFCAEAGL